MLHYASNSFNTYLCHSNRIKNERRKRLRNILYLSHFQKKCVSHKSLQITDGKIMYP